MPALQPLPAVGVRAVELVSPRLSMTRPLRSAAGPATRRGPLLVRVEADEADGWAECAVEAAPGYDADHRDGEALVLHQHLLPLAWTGPIGEAAALEDHLATVRGHHPARAALLLAVLDAQLRAAGASLASWLGATAASVAAGAALGLHADPDDLLAEADEALAAGAARLRVKIAPGQAAVHLRALREHVGDQVALQADANGSFAEDDRELAAIDELGLACLEQPLPPDDLLGHARLAERLATPICLDEPLTSLGAVEAAVALGACEVVCLKPARVGGWAAARAVHDRCGELGVPVWLGGMLETSLGRAANLAVAALPGMALAPDADPRSRYDTDLADLPPPVEGRWAVPTGPGVGVTPEPSALVDAEVLRLEAP